MIKKVSNSVRNAFNINSPKIAKFPWLHSVYWFQDNQKLIDVAKDKNSIMHKNFTYLLHSEFDDDTYFPDRYMFYGWARSLMIIGNKDIPNYNQWLQDKLAFMEIAQYIYSGLNLLDYLLSETRKGSEIDLQEPITESERRQLKYKIKEALLS